jgi:hypothetical protein
MKTVALIAGMILGAILVISYASYETLRSIDRD